MVHRYALVRGVSPCFAEDSLKREQPEDPIDLDLARQQHHSYVERLRAVMAGPVIEVEEDQNHGDCCFIEDTAVVIGADVVINHMGAPTRRGEETPVRRALELLPLGLAVHEMHAPAICDGGDVLHIPGTRDLFVGISERTNTAGVEFLTTVFRRCNVLPIRVPKHGLHLKSVITHIPDPGNVHRSQQLQQPQCPQNYILVVSNDVSGLQVWQQIEQLQSMGRTRGLYRPVFVNSQASANVLAVNIEPQNRLQLQKTLHHHRDPDDKDQDRCFEVVVFFREDGVPEHDRQALLALEHELHNVYFCSIGSMSEFAKADGALTCCSILIDCPDDEHKADHV